MTLEEFFNQIQLQFTNKLPFVVYRKPNEDSVNAMLQEDDTLHKIDDFTESGFVFLPFDEEEDSIVIPYKNSKNIQCDYIILSAAKRNEEPVILTKVGIFLNESESFLEKAQHINLVKNGIEAIKNKQFQKVVLSRCETVALLENNPITIFKRLLENYKTAFVYCWYHPKVGLWLGATPETLLKVEGNIFSTMALAGTQDYNGTLDVSWQNKEKQEQQFVTDYIVSSLGSSISSLKIGEAATVKAGNLLHLQTNISGSLKPQTSNLKNLLHKLHPTPAVCGLPKDKAKQFILKSENYNREFYTGFLGELNLQEKRTRNPNRHNVENNAYASVKKVSNLYVNLRCMQVKNNDALIYVGGGITQNSIPESEWEETLKKTKTIKSVL